MATWVDRAIAEFGRSIGVGQLSFGEAGVLSLQLDAFGTLFIEQAEGCVLIYLARSIPLPHNGTAARLLTLSHYDEGLPMAVNPGLRGEDAFVLSVRVPESEFSLPLLEQAMALLLERQRRMDG
jgi:type III secretion system chaperone SycN